MDITIFTQDQMYAYNFRNKLLNEKWNSSYIYSLDELFKSLEFAQTEILFVDISNLSQECISKIYNYRGNIIVTFLDEKGVVEEGSYQDIIVSNINNIANALPLVKEKYLRKIVVSDMFIMNKVAEQLSHFSISPKSLGYTYLKECIMIGIKMDSKFLCYKNEVYPVVASAYHVSTSAIEKSIRQAISKANKLFPDLFNTDEFRFGHVTNNSFMNYIIEKVISDNLNLKLI